jgi:ubiquinone/menaquinone biosynthesis C-methylase UbiE
MILNGLEYAAMNNPARAWVQRHVEARKLAALGGTLDGGRALEVGCGRGVGIEIILDRFGADAVDAFDLDPRMVRLARRRHRARGGAVRIWRGDATAIPARDGAYDAVFDFGIIHHVPDWRAALAEIHRVLRPGGRFYAEEILAKFINKFPWRQLLDHPREDRFTGAGFARGLEETGFTVAATAEILGEFSWFIADK